MGPLRIEGLCGHSKKMAEGARRKSPPWRLDCDRKAPGRVALRAFESADFIARCCRLDVRQSHGLAAFGAREDSDLCTTVYWIGMDG
jgi:hypothetical protein